MGKVQTLREDVYKKIAAGEVVERPLSVVKELVENALDAGADNIVIDIAEGGKRSIKVTDNGSGFHSDDIETAFKNHSTSKISELDDFNTLTTLGFRGEALPSIMEVSRIDVHTCDNTEGRGVFCRMEGGQILHKEDIAGNPGTAILVKDLFYNFPVRQKFLKTERTELNQIVSFLEPVSLVHYDKSFQLDHNGKTVFLYKKTESLEQRIYQVFGKDFLDALQEVSFEYGGYRISGYVSRLNTGLSVKKHQYFFVNRRPVREKTLIAAVNNTFQKYLEKSRHPAAILMLEVPPAEVDVNIHPMKLEIKFENSSGVYQLIKLSIEESFGTADEFEKAGINPGSSWNYSSGSSSKATGTGGGYGGLEQPRFRSDYSPGTGSTMPQETGPMQVRPFGQEQPPPPDFQQNRMFTDHLPGEDDFAVIGQYKNSYILIEKNDDLLLVDQHNAQERVNFDQLKKEYLDGSITSVTPLFPVLIELTPSEAARVDEEKLALLKRLGFRLESLGGNSYDIKSFPQILGERNIKEAVRTVIHMEVTSKEDEANFEDSVLAEVACKSAIKVNHKLYPDQMRTIVANLFKTTNPYFCPHKRPIIVEYTLEDIEKKLKRR